MCDEASEKCERKGSPVIVIGIRGPASEVVTQRLNYLIQPVADYIDEDGSHVAASSDSDDRAGSDSDGILSNAVQKASAAAASKTWMVENKTERADRAKDAGVVSNALPSVKASRVQDRNGRASWKKRNRAGRSISKGRALESKDTSTARLGDTRSWRAQVQQVLILATY
ncbi:hypothetical protein FVE85_7673 [Porphyridium purpureum]|uniref:Uncharacterized protein n=1 Tax=Porphyridium purpureum TaxID=35688 RepID=A0A5J4ZAH6_PORPP|nr:hypothetical protein FVE85_7673 [Porphyridium purpureum]|eukprot:POR4344..scf295_1